MFGGEDILNIYFLFLIFRRGVNFFRMIFGVAQGENYWFNLPSKMGLILFQLLVNAVIGNAVLRKIVSADFFTAVAGTDL